MKASHTPGPWHFDQPWNGFSAIRAANGDLIFGIAAGSDDEKRPDAECCANARLIAAAPEMFAKIKLIAAWFQQLEDERAWLPGNVRDAYPHLAELRSIVAKVEGKDAS